MALAVLTFVTAAVVGLTVALVTASARRQSNVDPDTGLPNGFGLAERFRTSDRSSDAGPLVVATIVLRGLSEARDALGYRVGTELLRRVVEDLGQVQPADARLGRVEGDELVVVQPLATVLGDRPAIDLGHRHGTSNDASDGDGDAADAGLHRHASALIDAIGSGVYTVGKIEVSLGAHVGLAVQPVDGDDLTELIRRASWAARRAVVLGQATARWEHNNEQMTATDLDMLADLRGAPTRGELWVAYQPQIAPRSGTTVSVEALLRWNSPRHGNVPPGVFIPLAERVGLVDRLTDWVLGESLDAQRRWRDRGIELPVSINISPLSLSDPSLAERILTELTRRALPAEALSVEVTETAAVDLVQAVDRLRPLHDHGVRVSIDDFGTGYTSLSVLPQLPLDELKVDQRFVRASATSKADDAIVQSVRELAHRLGLHAVAEGVEDASLAERMTEIGFDLLQGYHFARPLPEVELLAFVAREREHEPVR
jgi:diguanylate cyclase